jgi:hypothetical protein
MTFMAGSMVAAKFVNPGDTVQLAREGLGELNLQVAWSERSELGQPFPAIPGGLKKFLYRKQK